MSSEKPVSDDLADATTMRLIVDLTIEPIIGQSANSSDEEESQWFHDEVLGDPELFLHSNLIGDTLGIVKVVDVLEPPKNDSKPASPPLHVVWELCETEYWDDRWNTLGLYTSRHLAEEAQRERESLMRRDFDELSDFSDWYSWIITPAELSGNPGQLEPPKNPTT